MLAIVPKEYLKKLQALDRRFFPEETSTPNKFERQARKTGPFESAHRNSFAFAGVIRIPLGLVLLAWPINNSTSVSWPNKLSRQGSPSYFFLLGSMTKLPTASSCRSFGAA
jgi:hypothetical protein